jgi:hypothetical protein
VDIALALIDDTPQERDWFPWRLPHMSSSARVAALVAIGAVILAGAFALVGPGRTGPPLPSTAPSLAPSQAVSSPGITMSQTFSSEIYGYSVDIPAGWAATTASKLWPAGTANAWNSGYNDELSDVSAGLRFSGASQRLSSGVTADAWLRAYAAGADPTSWPKISIDGKDGFLTADAVPAAGGTIAPGGVFFDAVVIDADRAYNFNMDGKLDRATFDAFVATIKLDPTAVGVVPSLEKPFTSPYYGYSVLRAGDWTVTPATKHWKGVDNSPPATDEIKVARTDTTISIASQPLGKQTLDEFLVSFHEFTKANVPTGCDGGEPATWHATKIGNETGRWYELCNAAEAVVAVGGRVYAFTWGNDTFDTSGHLSLESWLKVLETVTFAPKDAVDR